MLGHVNPYANINADEVSVPDFVPASWSLDESLVAA